MEKLSSLLRLLNNIYGKFVKLHPKVGHPYTYGQIGMIFFFITVLLKGITQWKSMETYGQIHYKKFGFPQAPCRQTIKRRFIALGDFLKEFIPFLAIEVQDLDDRFSLKIGFIDKCLFWAKGGVWHRKQMKSGVVPNKKIDTQASWGKSLYQGWVFGYGLHVIGNMFRFPFSATVDTAKVKEKVHIESMIIPIKHILMFLVGDNGYRVIKIIKNIYVKYKILIITSKPYKTVSQFKQWYSEIIKEPFIRKIFKKRKPSIEPIFSLIKELFGLTGRNSLPFKGLEKTTSFLLLAVFTIQVLMIFNSINQLPLCQIRTFKNIFL